MRTTRIQEQEEEHPCLYEGCTRIYKSRFSLKRHHLSHMGIRKHKCPYCSKGFSLAQYLREHIHIHTGEKPFVCTYPGCDKKFRQAGKLSIHKKEHSTTGSPDNKSDQSQINDEVLSNLHAVQAVFEQLKNFTIPSFFFSKVLPLPSQVKAQKEVIQVLRTDYQNYKKKTFVSIPIPRVHAVMTSN